MIHLRPAYTPPLAGRFRAVAVGAEAQAAPQPSADGSARTALYVGLPALGLGVLAYLVGWTTPVALLAAGAGGLGGYIVSTRAEKAPPPPPSLALPAGKKETCLADLDAKTLAPIEEAIKRNDGVALAAYVKEARDHGWECAAREIEKKLKVVEDAEKDRRANLDVKDVAAEAVEPMVTHLADVFSTVTVAVEAGKEPDYKSSMFVAKPSDAVVKMIDDLASALGAAGYTKAQGQIADIAAAAMVARDKVDVWTPISRTAAMKIPGAVFDFGLVYTDPKDPSRTMSSDEIDASYTSKLTVGDTAMVFAERAGAVGPAVVKIASISGVDYRGIVLNPASPILAGLLGKKIITALGTGPSPGMELRFIVSDVAAAKPISKLEAISF